MRRIITAIAAFALAFIGLAVPASADEAEELANVRGTEPTAFDLDEPPEPTSKDWDCGDPGEVIKGGIELPKQRPWVYDILKEGDDPSDGPQDNGEFHVLPADTYIVEANPDAEGDNEWSLTIEDLRDREDCLVEITPEEPAFEHPVCIDAETTEPGSLAIPEQEGVVYEPAEGSDDVQHGDAFDVSASPDEGYAFPEGVTADWSYIAVVVPCDGTDGEDGDDGKDGETPPPATSDKDCDDFETRAQVNAHIAAFPGDLDRLDGDDDGVACDAIKDEVTVTSVSNTSNQLPKTGAGYEMLALAGLGLMALGGLVIGRRRIGAKLFNR